MNETAYLLLLQVSKAITEYNDYSEKN